MNWPTLTKRAAETPTGALLRRVCLFAATSAALLCTHARAQDTPAPERPSDFFEQLGAPFAGKKLARPTEPMLGLAASANVVQLCPGNEAAARVALNASGFDPSRRRLRYTWRASGGRVEGAGESVTWDLSGVAPGAYSINVSLGIAGDASTRLADREARVMVRACRPPPTRRAACPTISLCCRSAVTAGEPAIFEATLEGGALVAAPTYQWSLSAGRILGGAGTPSIDVDTQGLGGQTLIAVFEPRGYGASCRSSCMTSVLRAPTPTPTPTPTKPSPTPTPHVAVVATPTPTPTPTPSPTPTPVVTSRLPPSTLSFDPSTPALPALPRGDETRYAMLLLVLGTVAIASYFGLKYRSKALSAAEGVGGAVVAAVPAALTAAAATEEEGDEVRCTVFAPNQCAPGSMFLVQAFAHLPEHAPLLLEMANASDEDATQRGTEELAQKIERDKELVFDLRMPGLTIDEPTQSLVWRGEPEAVQFGVAIPETARVNTSIIGTVVVSYESVPVGHVKFKFKICPAPDAAQAPQPTQPTQPPPEKVVMEVPSQGFVRYRRAFISYASADRTEVLKRVQMLKTMKIDFFHDLLSLEPGDRWERELYKHIDESDVFFLFWSEAAKKSRWVEREIQYAMERKRGNDTAPPEITPIILEGPPIVPPPDYLGNVHFNDTFLYLITAEQYARRAAPKSRARASRAVKKKRKTPVT